MPVRLEIAYLLIALMVAGAVWAFLHLTRERRAIRRRRREWRRARKAAADQ